MKRSQILMLAAFGLMLFVIFMLYTAFTMLNNDYINYINRVAQKYGSTEITCELCSDLGTAQWRYGCRSITCVRLYDVQQTHFNIPNIGN